MYVRSYTDPWAKVKQTNRKTKKLELIIILFGISHFFHYICTVVERETTRRLVNDINQP